VKRSPRKNYSCICSLFFLSSAVSRVSRKREGAESQGYKKNLLLRQGLSLLPLKQVLFISTMILLTLPLPKRSSRNPAGLGLDVSASQRDERADWLAPQERENNRSFLGGAE
jgi:hypothetical protein